MPGRRHRRDVEGLRAVAVLAVVAYHAGLPLPGGFAGVDVFFVLSGFLITGLLVAELDATGRLDLPRFYARRIRRLLPMALLVVATTVVLALALLDPISARDVVRDAAFTVTGLANWHLAAVGADYLNASGPPSPWQHFWSLAVEEQFYLCWPLLLLLAAGLARRARRARRAGVGVALGLVLAGSLLLSALTTGPDPIRAYFGTHTRAWELALGGLVALAAGRAPSPAVPARARAALSWLGLLGIAASVALLDATVAFPGVAALAPTLATAAVLLGGQAPGGAVELLRRGPLQALGRWSYGWYLWHWPLLVLLVPRLADTAPGEVPALTGTAVAAAALGLTVVTFRLVEHPLRLAAWPLRRPALTGLTAVAVSAGLAAGALGVTASSASAGRNRGDDTTLPALASTAGQADAAVAVALRGGLQLRDVPAEVTPPLGEARALVPDPARTCHAGFEASTVDDAVGRTRCVYGDRTSATVVVLYGDSHALQWFPAMERIAALRHWRLVPITKSACPPFAVDTWLTQYRRPYRECRAWQASALRQLTALHPALVVMSAKTGVDDHGLDGGGSRYDEAWGTGTGTAVAGVRAATHAPVVLIEDTPLPPVAIGMLPACLAEHPHDVAACTFDASAGDRPAPRRQRQREAAVGAGAVLIDPRPWFCLAGRCPAIVGRTLVYRDTDHVSVPYARWLAPALAARLPAVAAPR